METMIRSRLSPQTRRLLSWTAIAVGVFMIIAFYRSKTSTVDSVTETSGPSNDIGSLQTIAKLRMTDPALLDLIRRDYVDPPDTEPYNLSRPYVKHYSQYQQSEWMAQLFENKTTPGIFFEAGAFDGEEFSNSLHFEKSLNWTGLLVEPNPSNIAAIRRKHRKATLVRSCISGSRPVRLTFDCRPTGAYCQAVAVAAPDNPAKDQEPKSGEEKEMVASLNVGRDLSTAWCFPLYSVLLATGFSEIDYMVLDLEYHELTALSALPLDKVRIKVMQVEFMIVKTSGKGWDDARSKERLEQIRAFFRTKWPMYTEYKVVVTDVIFTRTDLMPF